MWPKDPLSVIDKGLQTLGRGFPLGALDMRPSEFTTSGLPTVSNGPAARYPILRSGINRDDNIYILVAASAF